MQNDPKQVIAEMKKKPKSAEKAIWEMKKKSLGDIDIYESGK